MSKLSMSDLRILISNIRYQSIIPIKCKITSQKSNFPIPRNGAEILFPLYILGKKINFYLKKNYLNKILLS